MEKLNNSFVDSRQLDIKFPNVEVSKNYVGSDEEKVNYENPTIVKLDKIDNKVDVLTLFHHIHHLNNCHIVHHCGGNHSKINVKVNYNIKHCNCNKHNIDKSEAIGHDSRNKEILIEFIEQCPEGGWHIEGGITVEVHKND